MIRNLLSSLICFAAILVTKDAFSQTIPVGTPVIEDHLRRAQLSGEIDSNISFTVRPILMPVLTDKSNDSYLRSTKASWDMPAFFSRFSGTLLPVVFQTQYNSDHPYGWNDGPMIPSKGLQTYLSTGFYAKYGPLTIQLQPEFVIAANKDFDDFNKLHYAVTVAHYYDFYNNIDLPTRFGTSEYNKAFWGQSSIRLNYKDLSFGVSTENLWWGPGIRNSLIMSNDAPGFKHFTLNTLKPIHTFLGSFEGQLIAGTLQNSNFAPLTPDRYLLGSDLYLPKPDLPRHISGLVFTWQPKWVSGLFLGLTRSSQLYSKDVKGITDYLPFFSEFSSVTADQPVYKKKDYRSSLFARWLWTSEKAEVYFEYGHNNNANDLKDEVLEPQNNRAYTVGVRKMVPFNSAKGEQLLFSIETTEMAETSPADIADLQSWYVNKYIRQGYTNLGQSLGAGIGPGSNLQSLDVSWIKGLKRIGIQIERFLHNDDFYYYAYAGTQDIRRHWVDLSVAGNCDWNYKNLILSAKIQYIYSQNYQYYLNPALENINNYYVNGYSANNFQLRASIMYRF